VEKQQSFFDEVDKAASGKLLHFEDCASAIDQLFQQAYSVKGLSAFDEFLGFIARFNNLSAFNAMLVRVQRPGAAAVGSRRQWREVGRLINPDAIPIVVLQPFGPVRYVYEISDTEGDDIPGESASSLFAVGTVPQEQFDRTKGAAVKYGVLIEETDHYGALLAGTAAAIKQFPEQIKMASKGGPYFRVKLNAKHDMPTRFATLAHELGHIYCGHQGRDVKGRWPNRAHLTYPQRELEAEAVAWLVCQRTGVQSRSNEYLSKLVSEESIDGISLYAIFEAANRVESRTSPGDLAAATSKRKRPTVKAKPKQSANEELTTEQIGKLFDEAVAEVFQKPKVAITNVPTDPDLTKAIEGLNALFGPKPLNSLDI
jgi:hypothetical protein